MLNAFLTGAVIPILAAIYFHTEMERARRALDKERYDHSVTRERLLAAHKDGYVIPPPPSPVEDKPDLSLPDELQPIWESWESPAGQEQQKKVLRQLIVSGRTPASLLAEYGFTPPA